MTKGKKKRAFQKVDATEPLAIQVGRSADGKPTVQLAGSTDAPLVYKGRSKRGGIYFGLPSEKMN